MDRREFLRAAAAAGMAGALADAAAAAPAALPQRTLGRTGRKLSIIGMGGIVLMGNDQPAADRLVSEAVDRGVTYFDVAPSYGDGEAEEKMGPALQPYRSRVFLACKTGRRDRAGAQEELDRSLKRLRTDHFDLYQLHGLTSAEEATKALGPGGAIETFVAARDKGQVRHLGFSAHSVEAALLAMDRFKFDTILFPVSWVPWLRGGFGPQVVSAARAKGMGVLALKAMAYRPWPADVRRDYPKCWYQPVAEPELASLALRWTLSQPVTAAVPPGDERLFRLALEVASRFRPLSEDERRTVDARAQGVEPIFRHGTA